MATCIDVQVYFSTKGFVERPCALGLFICVIRLGEFNPPSNLSRHNISCMSDATTHFCLELESHSYNDCSVHDHK